LRRIKWVTMRLRYYSDRRYVRISSEARTYLSKPLGKLYRPDGLEELRDTLYKARASFKLASVGDRVTKTLIDWSITPDIAVIDCMERRRPVNIVDESLFNLIIYVDNRRGMVNLSITDIIRKNLARAPILLKVGGEDDLVGIPVIMALDDGDIMLYGQPNEGIVLVEVTSKLKKRLEELIL